MPANTSCPKLSPAISSCFRAISITRCRETRASRESRSPSTPFQNISIAGAIASASRLEWRSCCAFQLSTEFAREQFPCLGARGCRIVDLVQQARGGRPIGRHQCLGHADQRLVGGIELGTEAE